MEPLTAREHALRASWLLADHADDQLEHAQAHALVALALCMTDEEPDADQVHE